MPVVTLNNLTTSPTGISDPNGFGVSVFLKESQTGKAVTMTSAQLELMAPQLEALKTASKISYSIAQDPNVPDKEEALAPVNGDRLDIVAATAVEGMLLVLRKAFTAGTAGTADDVTLYAAAAVPRKMRILDSYVIITTGINATTVTLRDTAAGAGAALSSAMSSATSGSLVRNALTTASAVIDPTLGLFLRRSDRGVAGEVVIYARPET